MMKDDRKNLPEPIYDIVMCVGKQHTDIAQTTLRLIMQFLQPHFIYVIIHPDHFNTFERLSEQYSDIKLVDESKFSPQVDFEQISTFIGGHAENNKRAGWYFQQFLKMQAYQFVTAKYYLIWDADTIPLRPIHFFNKCNHILIHPGKEHHVPYFETLTKLLGIKKQSSYSFISEHMMVDKEQMRILVSTIQAVDPSSNWPLIILSNINKQHLTRSGFSEYETFGNFLLYTGNTFCVRKDMEDQLKTFRFGARLLGGKPSRRDLFMLMQLGLHYVTFECWDTGEKRNIKRNKQLANVLYKIHPFWLLRPLKTIILQKIRKQIQHLH